MSSSMTKFRTESVSVVLIDQSGIEAPGVATVLYLTPRQAFWNGAKRSAKYIGILFLCALPLGILEPFLFMAWGSGLLFILIVLVGPRLHMKFANETSSFTEVQAECSYCHSRAPLKPYLSTQFKSEFTVLCSACGQTIRVTALSG
jgi:hypothetical protein